MSETEITTETTTASVVETKICNTCNESKPLDRYRPRCLRCMDCRNKMRREKRREVNPELVERDEPQTHRTCNKCNEEKKITGFRTNRRVCIDCERADGRAYRKANPEKNQAWAEANRQKLAELQHDHYEKNKLKIRAKYNERYQNDETFRAIKNHRKAVNAMYKNGGKTSKFCPFKGDEFRKWIEASLEVGMTKANYGTYWNFDHVLPLDLFEDEFYNKFLKQLFNIKPTVCAQNLTKNKYINKDLFNKHIKAVEAYFPATDEVTEYVQCLQDALLRESLDRS
tara:strand:- start:7831 stop:8682 length:852 start_codon:yes stop_codon:yes gene_type:complete